ncbi:MULTISPECIES: RnfABCDGE type electron transport complex subunit D [Duncaniella]|uniref:Ion-translocating oxidoreductase complex subunit D n=3 Tax=Duncaniella muris TaxID=2094150 RepID=A0A2V1IPV0_9BACT|nr:MULTISPECIES: RnfABCDGE type electron transport complex subunit D [Duncaniella]ROS89556.1 RnfABCDGE type electron transport complex subunit D [Muribaculaceae bacterium Isolate-039 (Harlan)]ROS97024.1 RnfABCDGE type electron transport complex subunit D [Muribaculaceae bacterium Isolate-077 (Janvier)]ROS99688.1 RnfABCDGE type electron transport complex subunit D [Muribaculaceae bacterium Isolate-083 (Janvier)]ROT00950.1 RnfABCDGE type electron transport complex subunit D [Muribaculaceae bacter
MSQLITISPSPHAHTPVTVRRLMLNVIVALLPAVALALYCFGLGAAVVIATSIAGCVVVEYLISRYMLGEKPSIGNLSAVLTGLLLALNLPSNLPIWTVLIGCVIAIGIGKMTFGGLGCNIFNPALVGRVFLLLSFPVQMTTWPLPMENRMAYLDATTGATTLGQLKMDQISGADVDILTHALGFTGGSMGEMGAIALLIGFIYLLCTRTITWHIPVSILATVALFSLCIGVNPGVQLVTGGLMLGAIFMATDYVTSPMSHSGMILYGVMIGIITVVIRQWGAYPEGVSFAILIMNGLTPLINRYLKPRKFGEGRVAA